MEGQRACRAGMDSNGRHLREDPTRMMILCTTPSSSYKKRAPDAVSYSIYRRRCRKEGSTDVVASVELT
jgi:hypothetical protein